MKKVIFLFLFVLLLQSSYVCASDIVDDDKTGGGASNDAIIMADKFLDDLFTSSRIVIKKVDFENIDENKVNINIDVDFDLTYLCNKIELDTVPVLNIPSYEGMLSTGIGLSYYFFANETEKPILRFDSDAGDRQSVLVKEHIDKNIFRYLIIQIDNNHFDQIFLSSRSGISLKESFNFVLSGVPSPLLNKKANLTILIVDKKRPRYPGAPEVHSRIIVKKEYPLPQH